MSLINYSRHIAFFYDSNGDYVGSKVMQRSFTSAIGLKSQVFKYKDGVYNIDPQISRGRLSGLFADTFFYHYFLNNPDPISFKHNNLSFKFDAERYKLRLESKLIKDLNNAYKEGLGSLFNMKWIIILLVLGSVAYYFFSGGTLT